MGDTLGQAGDPFAEGGEVPAEIPDLLAHVAQVGPEPSGQGDDQGGREPRNKGFHVPILAPFWRVGRRVRARPTAWIASEVLVSTPVAHLYLG